MTQFRINLVSSGELPQTFESLSDAADRRSDLDLHGAWQDPGGSEYLLVAAPTEQVVTDFVAELKVDAGPIARLSGDDELDPPTAPLFPGALVFCGSCGGFHSAPRCG